jgi:hypothetical protein
VAISTQEAGVSDAEKYTLRELNELEIRKQYQIEISNRFRALKILNESKNIKRALENIKVNIKTSVKESLSLYALKQHIP